MLLKNIDKDAFLAAFEQVLKPLLAIGHGFGVAGHEFRDSFSQAAAEFYAQLMMSAEERPVSSVRVGVYAGLNSSEARSRLTDRVSSGRSYARRSEALSAILNGWHSESGYSGVYDMALEIPFADADGSPSFKALCDRYAIGYDAKALLQELMDARCVDRLASGHLRAISRAYVLPPGNPARLERMGRALSNFGYSFQRILAAESDATFKYTERTVVSDYTLSEDGARAFDSEARDRGTKFLVDMDSWLTAQGRRLRDASGKQFGCGVYVFEDRSRVGELPLHLEDEDAEKARRARRSSSAKLS